MREGDRERNLNRPIIQPSMFFLATVMRLEETWSLLSITSNDDGRRIKDEDVCCACMHAKEKRWITCPQIICLENGNENN